MAEPDKPVRGRNSTARVDETGALPHWSRCLLLSHCRAWMLMVVAVVVSRSSQMLNWPESKSSNRELVYAAKNTSEKCRRHLPCNMQCCHTRKPYDHLPYP
jgi:hypothetical protein